MTLTEILKELQEIKKLLSLQKEILTLEEFCLYTGISKNQAYHLTSAGKVKFYRPFGKKIYFKLSEVVEFLTTHEVFGIGERNRELQKRILNKIL